jgi:hypothetical protein
VAGAYSPSVQGTGDLGGNGFRPGAVPILVYTTDATVRNAAAPYGQGPKNPLSLPLGCGPDAVPPLLNAALEAINARAIGVTARTDDALGAMQSIAQITDSWLDLDGDGNPDANEWMVWSSSDGAIVNQVVQGISEFTSNVKYDMTMVADDPADAIVTVTPTTYFDIPALNTVTFTLELTPELPEGATIFSDIVYTVPTTLLGDGEVVLAQWDLIFVVSPPPPMLP